MSAKYEEQWKPRMIRMSDELWQEIKDQAKLKDICAAEFVRLSSQKELNQKEVEILHDGEVIGVYTKGVPVKKSVYTKPDEPKTVTLPGKYACGCSRGEKKLCQKHHRL